MKYLGPLLFLCAGMYLVFTVIGGEVTRTDGRPMTWKDWVVLCTAFAVLSASIAVLLERPWRNL